MARQKGLTGQIEEEFGIQVLTERSWYLKKSILVSSRFVCGRTSITVYMLSRSKLRFPRLPVSLQSLELEIVVFILWSDLYCTNRILNFVSFNVWKVPLVSISRKTKFPKGPWGEVAWLVHVHIELVKISGLQRRKFAFHLFVIILNLTHLVINKEKAKLVLSWYKPDWQNHTETHCVTLFKKAIRNTLRVYRTVNT